MTATLAARLVLHPDLVRQLLGLPAEADIRHAELSADGHLHLVVHGAGLPVVPYGAAQVTVGTMYEFEDYGHHKVKTIDWGFTRKQLT